MPRVQFTKIDASGRRDPMPAGEYIVEIKDISIGRTRQNDEKWGLKLEVLTGEHLGCRAYDSLSFSNKGEARAKLVCMALGLRVDKDVNLQTKHLIGRRAVVVLADHEYEDDAGIKHQTTRVGYNGWASLSEQDFQQLKAESGEGDVPDEDNDPPF